LADLDSTGAAHDEARRTARDACLAGVAHHCLLPNAQAGYLKQ
jgi:hypothetical protein